MILSTWQFSFFRPKEAIIVAIIKTKSATIAFFFSPPRSVILISAVSARAQQRSIEPAFGRLFTHMTGELVTFKKKTVAVRCFQLRKKVLRLDAFSYQSTFIYDYKIRTSPSGGTNDNDAHACEPNYITLQNKIKAKILPVNKLTTLKFLSFLHSMIG